MKCFVLAFTPARIIAGIIAIVIYYTDVASSSQGGQVEKQLFPDQAKMKREEQRRWELTEVHWDLPIRQIDPNAVE
jgi:hypothetical protein